MRIALVAQACDARTGIGRIVRALGGEFTKANHEVDVVAQHISNCAAAVATRRIPALHVSNAMDKLLFNALSPRVIGQRPYDVINTFGVGRVATIVTAQSCHRAGMEILRPYTRAMIWSRNLGVYDRVSVRDERVLFTAPSTRRIIAVSRLVRDQIVSYYKVPVEKIAVVPNGVECELLSRAKSDPLGTELKKRLGLTPGDIVMLFVGNEFDRKGLQTILTSMRILHEPRAQLLVVGNDDPSPYRRFASSLGLGEQVKFLGGVATPEEYFGIADLFVFPSLYEPFGIVIIESMAAGVPVITSKSCGAVEGMVHGRHGLYLEDPASAEEVAAAIHEVCTNGALRQTLVAAGREAARGFSWETIAAKTLAVYDESLSMMQ